MRQAAERSEEREPIRGMRKNGENGWNEIEGAGER